MAYVCKKELQVLVVNGEDLPKLAEKSEGNEIGVSDLVEVSLNSVVGLTASKTMKLKGMIGSQEVVVLIDTGATHNFISMDLVKKLAIPRVATDGYGVLMGTGLAVQGDGVCKGVVLSLQKVEMVEYFLPLELGSSDVILGIWWLDSLGGMHVNRHTLAMKFKLGKTQVTL